MNEFDALEQELAAIRPRQPSAELKSRIADRLKPAMTRPMRSTPQSVVRRVAMIGGLLAACLAVAVIWWAGVPGVKSDSPDVPYEELMTASFRVDSPSVWTYRNAVVRSPASLDALLDQHSVAALELNSGQTRLQPFFVRLDSKTNDELGEL